MSGKQEFALFLREDSPDKWDLLISAVWLEHIKLKSFGEFIDGFKQIIGEEESMKLSRIVPLNRDEEGLWTILDSVRATRGIEEIRDVSFFGVGVKHGYVFRADRKQAPVEETVDY